MNCEEFWEKGPEDPDHLRECAACAARYQQEQHLAAGLKALGGQLRRVEAPARIERRLVRQFRIEAGVAPAPRRGLWIPVLTWGTAVAATVTLALLLVHGRQPQETRHARPENVQLAAVGSATPIELPTGITAEDGFIPLPNVEQIGPNEQVDVVRMEVPRSAVVALGIPVSDELASEKVEADVALGADGVARAVRLME